MPEVEDPSMAKRKPGPQPVDGGRVATVPIRSTAAWKTWAEGFMEWDRAPSMADLVDRALVAYARERKYPEPAPRR